MNLQTELSYLKDLFRKKNNGKSDLSHLLSLGYNRQTNFSKKTKFASSKKGEPKQGFLKE